MSLICVIDFETTGLSAEKNSILSVGSVVYDYKRRRVVDIYYSLVFPNETDIPKKISEITGIEMEDVKTFGRTVFSALYDVIKQASECEAFFAANCSFDKSFFDKHIEQNEHVFDESFKELRLKKVKELPWFDVLYDFEWPNDCPGRRVFDLAFYYKLGTFGDHNALSDALTCLQLLQTQDIEGFLERRDYENSILVYGTSTDIKLRDDYKRFGFRWSPEKKRWFKKITKTMLLSGWAETLPKEITVYSE